MVDLALSMLSSIWHVRLTARLLGLACAGFPVYWDVALTANSSQRELQYLKDGVFLDVASSGMRMLLMTYSALLDAFGYVLHVAQLGHQVAQGATLANTGQSVSPSMPLSCFVFRSLPTAGTLLLLAALRSTVHLTQTWNLPALVNVLLSFKICPGACLAIALQGGAAGLELAPCRADPRPIADLGSHSA